MAAVLVISDDRDLRRTLVAMLNHLGMVPVTARQVRECAHRAECRAAELVLLDLGVLDVALAVRGVRDRMPVPVMTTSTRGVGALALALDAGADDHIEQPIAIEELGARIRSLVRRRVVPPEHRDVVTTPAFTLDLVARQAFTTGGEVHLTRIEWALVDLLVRHPDRLMTQERLLTSIWGPESTHNSEYLRVHMHAVRAKLEPDPHHPRYFLTVPGVGLRYRRDLAMVDRDPADRDPAERERGRGVSPGPSRGDQTEVGSY